MRNETERSHFWGPQAVEKRPKGFSKLGAQLQTSSFRRATSGWLGAFAGVIAHRPGDLGIDVQVEMLEGGVEGVFVPLDAADEHSALKAGDDDADDFIDVYARLDGAGRNAFLKDGAMMRCRVAPPLLIAIPHVIPSPLHLTLNAPVGSLNSLSFLCLQRPGIRLVQRPANLPHRIQI